MSAPNRPLPVILVKAAQADFEDIHVYTVRTWDEDQWLRYRAMLERAFLTLGDNPLLGRARDDLKPGYRTYLVEQHIILYRIATQAVLILRIVHGRADVQQALRRR